MRQISPFLLAIVLVSAAAYLYLSIFILPSTPVLLGDDQVYFWADAQRMLHGERPYLDFFQYTPPGTNLFFLGLFRLFGARIWVLNLAVLMLGLALCAVCFCVASQIMENHLALLATELFLVLIFGRALNATHHWFSVLMIMCAVAVIIRKRTPERIAITGGFLGFATFFTHTHGVAAAAAVAILLIWERSGTGRSWRELLVPPAVLCLSFVASVLALYAYFVASVGLGRLWYEQISYVRRYALEGFANFGLPAPLTSHNLTTVGQQVFVYLLLPVTYIIGLLRFSRRPNGPGFDDDRSIALLSLVGIFLLGEVAVSPNWLRIYAVSMPGIIVAISLVGRTESMRRYFIPLIVGVACLAFTQVWRRHHQQYIVTELPGGTAAVPAPNYEKLIWLAQHTKPGDFFFQAAWPGMYVPLGLRNPVFLDAVGTNEQTRPEYVELTVSQLEERKVHYILWSPRLDSTDLRRTGQNHLGPLRDYLHNQYSRVQTFADQDEIWERK